MSPIKKKKLAASGPTSFRSRTFDYSIDYASADLREHPELYRVGRGEQGVLLVEPYKSELLPFWRFKSPEVAKKSVSDILKLFRRYRKQNDFVGMDMARKFLQMGYTRSRRYANHRSGKKYALSGETLPKEVDKIKAKSAAIFFEAWKRVEANSKYAAAKTAHKQQWG